MFIVSRREVRGEVPGLESVAMAMGIFLMRRVSIGGSLVSRTK